jgi:hypothetical protein
VTLVEIVEATGWRKRTVRGFVSILGSKGRQKIESSKNAAGAQLPHREIDQIRHALRISGFPTPLPVSAGRRYLRFVKCLRIGWLWLREMGEVAGHQRARCNQLEGRLTLTYGLRWDVDVSASTVSGPNISAVTGVHH